MCHKITREREREREREIGKKIKGNDECYQAQEERKYYTINGGKILCLGHVLSYPAAVNGANLGTSRCFLS